MRANKKLRLFNLCIGIFSMSVLAAGAQTGTSWQSDLEAAEKSYLAGDETQAKTYYERALGEASDDTARATILNQMGVAQIKLHRFVDAQKSFSDAFELRKKRLGESDSTTLQTLSNLALATYKNGDEVEAEKLYQECIERKRKVSPNSESLAKSLTNLANLYTDERKCAEAKTLYLEAAEVDSAVFGAKSVQTGLDLFNAGAMLQKCQQPKEALVYLDRANSIFEALGDKHGQVRSLHYSGLSHGDMKNFDQAAQVSMRALNLHEQLKGQGHPDTVVHMLSAGDALAAASRDAEAEKLYLQALHTVKAAEHPSGLFLTQCNLALAQLCRKEKRTDDAEQYFKKAMIHYEDLSKKEKRELYELPLAYSQLLKELQQDQESEHLNHKYLNVYAPDKAR